MSRSKSRTCAHDYVREDIGATMVLIVCVECEEVALLLYLKGSIPTKEIVLVEGKK